MNTDPSSEPETLSAQPDADVAVVPEAAPEPTPGARIREARERARLSLDDMSIQTKLAKATLESLERDDYNALLEPVYVRGYYRKCAKVLNLDEESLIQAYAKRVTPKSPLPPAKLRLASGTELGSSSRIPVALVVLAAIAAIVAGAFYWFMQDEPQGYPPVPVTLPTPTVQELLPVTTPTPVAVVDDNPSATASRPETQDLAAEPTTSEPTAAAVEPTPVPVSGGDGLMLRFVDLSWVRIEDAGGRSLANGMKQAGDTLTLSGALPLNVFLGNAPGVEVRFQGQMIDTQPFTRSNDTARFVLPLE